MHGRKNEHLRILIIEDNPGDLRIIEEMLRLGAPYLKTEMTAADSLNRALINLSENEYDIIITDLGLPDSQGLDTFRSVNSHAANTPVIVLTGLQDEAMGVNAVKEGAQDYLVKGQIGAALLARSIRYSIERFRLEKELKNKADEIEGANRMLSFERDMEVEKLRNEIERLKRKKE